MERICRHYRLLYPYLGDTGTKKKIPFSGSNDIIIYSTDNALGSDSSDTDEDEPPLKRKVKRPRLDNIKNNPFSSALNRYQEIKNKQFSHEEEQMVVQREQIALEKQQSKLETSRYGSKRYALC